MPKPFQDRYQIEELTNSYQEFVKEIVYQAIYVHPGTPAPTRDILNSSDLTKYYEAWGKTGDFGLVAIHYPSEQPIGGAFVRYYKRAQAGYGFLSEYMPELNIALLPDHRGKGLGSQLLDQLLTELRKRQCPGVSLSVDKRNPAIKLYQRSGFRTVREEGNPTMLMLFD